MCPLTLLPATGLLHLERVLPETGVITLVASTCQTHAACPRCGHPAERVHSRYTRTVADLPWQGVAVRLRLAARRFFCDNGQCERRIFTEPLPQVVARYARRTDRLADALRLIGYALGGEAGARLARELGLIVSPDTLLRNVTGRAQAPAQTPRVLGVDDWAFRRGHRYGTILVDLERHRLVDLLPDREAATLAAWLQAHPGVEVISRDRASAYAEGARLGAPDALQVADRWHLLRNLGDAVARLLLGHQPEMREAARQMTQPSTVNSAPAAAPAGAGESAAEPPPSPAAQQAEAEQKTGAAQAREQESAERRERRLAHYTQVQELRRQGLTIDAIARQVGVGRRTVNRYLRAPAFPERSRRRRSARPVDAFGSYLKQRWDEGCHNVAQLYREMKAQGFAGSYATVWAAVHVGGQTQGGRGRASPPPAPSSYSVACWLQGHLSTKPAAQEFQQAFLERLCQLAPPMQEARVLAGQFDQIVRERQCAALPGWLEQARHGQCAELRLFEAGLRQDLSAVTAALSSAWSNGQTEGQVNRLKTLKRQMYGRAGFGLLRARVLSAC